MADDWQKVQNRERREWLNRYDLKEAKPPHACLTWLSRGRHAPTRCLELPRWADHPSAWTTPDGGRVLLAQPYDFEYKYLGLSLELNAYPKVHLRFERRGWWHPATTLIEIWESEEVYNKARK